MNKNLVISIIFAAGAFAFFVLVLPEINSVLSARAALAARQSLLEERTAELKKIDELNGQYKARQADIDKLLVFLPEKKRIDEIISSTQQIAGQSGFNLTDLTISSSTEAGAAYKKTFVGFSLIGQYPAFVNFLKLLEQNLRLYDVSGIDGSLNATSGGAAQNLVNFNIKLDAYNLK